MPQYGPAQSVTASGITIDGQGFMLIPNDVNARPFKVTEDPSLANRFLITVLKAGVAKVIHIADV